MPKRYLFSIVLLTILFSLRFNFFYRNLPVYTASQKITLASAISSEPDISGNIQRFSFNLPQGEKVFVTTNKYPLYHYGQYIDISGRLDMNVKEGRVLYSMGFPKIRASDRSTNPLMAMALFLRVKATVLFESVLSPLDSALLLGIVFGIKQHMPDEFQEQLRSAGVMHVIAASGMNVTMVAGALFYIFNRLWKRRFALVAGMAGVIIYVFIAGAEPSIVRAAVMAGFTFAAGIGGRQKIPLYILIITAALMLFISPFLLYDVGFQLSFLATLGILIVKPLLGNLNRLGVLGDDLTTTLAAQIGTLPILLINFGSVNLLSVVVNMLVLWTIPFIMAIGGVAAISGLFFVRIGQFITYLTIPLLRYFEIVIAMSDGVGISLQINNASPVLWAGYYVMLGAIVLTVHKRNYRENGK